MTEIRKVRFAHGGKDGSSLIISLPKKLCNQLNIIAGNHVSLDIQGKGIIIKKNVYG